MAQLTKNLKVFDEEAERKQILREYRKLLRKGRDRFDNEDKKQIRKAFEMSLESHQDMRRKSGEPYILHPLAVAQIAISEMGLGRTAIVCALLHDVVEDTEVSIEDIEREFGNKVARIIDGLTKIAGVFDLSTSEQAENFRKLLLTLADDVRVILIKIADRLHNMRTMQTMPRNKQLKISSETLSIYAPLAHRLGLYVIKTELEDLSMKYTETEMYKTIARKLRETKRERNRYINRFIKPLKQAFHEEGVNCSIFGRPKSIHSIYDKMKKKSVSFEEVYDLFAIRVILQDVPPEKEKAACWHAYSIVTDHYRPNPGRLRDWISTPKVNGYESLHTTVMGPKGRWVEVQIRTERMDEIAEKGYASHWKYKENTNNNGADNGLDEWLSKIRDLLKNPESNALDFIDNFKLNLFNEEVYVFTPKGELRRLPANATALDFAFDIHSEVGSHCIGAKVNHKLVPLSHPLNNGDQVEIITSKKQQPTEDWLSYVVTAKARSSIKSSLKREKKEIAEQGKEELERKLKKLNIPFTSQNLSEILQLFNFSGAQDFYYAITKKKVDLSHLKEGNVDNGKLKFPKPEQEEKEVSKQNGEQNLTEKQIDDSIKEKLQENAELLIFGESSDQIAYSFAKCCNPIPGDDVLGFITATNGLKIHKTNCPNAIQLMANHGHRIVKTKWTQEHEIAFLTELNVSGIDDVGVMSKISDVISKRLKLNMRSLSIDSTDGIFEGKIMVYVHDTEQLDLLIQKLKELDGILSVTRSDS